MKNLNQKPEMKLIRMENILFSGRIRSFREDVWATKFPLVPAMLACTLALTCGCKPKKSEDTPSAAKPISFMELPDQVTATVTGAEAEKYTVNLSWPKLESGKTVRIHLNEKLTEVSTNQNYFSHVVAHNQTLNYGIDVVDASKKVLKSFVKSVSVPKDFVMPEKLDGFTEIEVNRVFISQGQTVITNGLDLKLVANEIHSQGSIRTYPANQFAPLGFNGRSAGNVSIEAKKLFGKLVVIMAGEGGGQGIATTVAPMRAAEGTPPGRGKIAFAHRRPDYSVEDDIICVSAGPAGGKGETGSQGFTGTQGFQGGDTGNLILRIEEVIALEGATDGDLNSDPVQIISERGAPGVGGVGGPGAPGGYGGGTTNTPKEIRCAGGVGPEGDVGPIGDTGPDGERGPLGKSCVYVGSQNINYCN